MTSKLGLHWLRYHPDGRDFDHIAKMQYRSVKTFEWMHGDRNFCNDLVAALPKDAYILARNHSRSEQKEDVWRDPVGTGVRHANEWANDLINGACFLPIDRTFFLPVNEPDSTHGDRDALDRYTEAYLDRLRVHGLRGGAFNFSTGHPRTVDGTGNTQADYTVFERSHRAIIRGHHIAALHIYGTANQPCTPGHYDRLKACAWQDVEWVVGECGADEHVIGGGSHDGYLISMRGNREAYCDWLDQLILGVNDSRIHSWQVFTYDYSHPWSSFDVREIRGALESYDWQHVKQAANKPTVTTHIPAVSTSLVATTPAYVVVIAGANIRSHPISGEILGAVPYAEQVQIVGIDDVSGWFKVRYGTVQGYMAPALVSLHEPQSQPTTPPVTATPANAEQAWDRSILFVLKQEGGLSTDPNDPGNYVDGKFVGTKYGISANAHPDVDIVNLTIVQAKSIYKEKYWGPSGASALPWPLCLAVLDLAVNGGVERAKEALGASGQSFVQYMAWRIAWYTRIDNFDRYGRAWIRRCSELMMEATR